MVEKNERKSAGSNELADYLTTKRIEFSYSTGKLGTDVDAAFEQVKATGGALLAFGLGADATIVGDNLAGLEVAPLATYPNKKFYRQYILLFHVDTSTPAGRLDYVGALDPCGFTIQQARKNVE